MPKRPKCVEIGPLVWGVFYDAFRLKESSYLDGQGKFGATLSSQLEILVDPDRPEQGIRETLLHEVIHAAIWTAGIVAGDEDDEEVLVSQMATVLLDILRTNKDLVRYLTASDGDL